MNPFSRQAVGYQGLQSTTVPSTTREDETKLKKMGRIWCRLAIFKIIDNKDLRQHQLTFKDK